MRSFHDTWSAQWTLIIHCAAGTQPSVPLSLADLPPSST